jgi:hypothetical protein
MSVIAAGTAVPKTSHLRKRETEHTLNSLSCGGFATADYFDTTRNIGNLRNDDGVFVPRGTCGRVGLVKESIIEQDICLPFSRSLW